MREDAQLHEAGVANWKRMGLKVLDVSYATAVRSTEEVIGKIYRFAGITLYIDFLR